MKSTRLQKKFLAQVAAVKRKLISIPEFLSSLREMAKSPSEVDLSAVLKPLAIFSFELKGPSPLRDDICKTMAHLAPLYPDEARETFNFLASKLTTTEPRFSVAKIILQTMTPLVPQAREQVTEEHIRIANVLIIEGFPEHRHEADLFLAAVVKASERKGNTLPWPKRLKNGRTKEPAP